MNRTDAARAMGKAKSPAKARAARENGRRGGRPNKELQRILEYLFDRCRQTCAVEREFNHANAHAPNCPVHDLGLGGLG